MSLWLTPEETPAWRPTKAIKGPLVFSFRRCLVRNTWHQWKQLDHDTVSQWGRRQNRPVKQVRDTLVGSSRSAQLTCKYTESQKACERNTNTHTHAHTPTFHWVSRSHTDTVFTRPRGAARSSGKTNLLSAKLTKVTSWTLVGWPRGRAANQDRTFQHWKKKNLRPKAEGGTTRPRPKKKKKAQSHVH